MATKTGFMWQEKFMWHEGGRYAGLMPAEFPVEPGEPYETPATKRRLKNLLDASGASEFLTHIKPREATDEELLRVHTRGYLAELAELSKQAQAQVGLDGNLTRGSYQIARLAAGGCLATVDAIYSGQVNNAYALARPIGHHAEADRGMGFCLLANPSLAAIRAIEVHGAKRVAIVDIDVHHGNGAQSIFWADPRVLTISIHQDRWFPPDTGDLIERGEGAGTNTNINIPLPAGSGWGAYEETFKRVVLPALSAFKADFLIMPCGYDAAPQDPLGRMIVHGGGYRQMTAMLKNAARETASGGFMVTHEGGYNPWTLPFYGLGVIETLAEQKTDVVDPYEEIFANMPGHDLLPHQASVIEAASAFVAEIPS